MKHKINIDESLTLRDDASEYEKEKEGSSSLADLEKA